VDRRPRRSENRIDEDQWAPFVSAHLATGSLAIQEARSTETKGLEAQVTELLSKDLTDLPGSKAGLMITVGLPYVDKREISRINEDE
jgi:hypothetical protein